MFEGCLLTRRQPLWGGCSRAWPARGFCPLAGWLSEGEGGAGPLGGSLCFPGLPGWLSLWGSCYSFIGAEGGGLWGVPESVGQGWTFKSQNSPAIPFSPSGVYGRFRSSLCASGFLTIGFNATNAAITVKIKGDPSESRSPSLALLTFGLAWDAGGLLRALQGTLKLWLCGDCGQEMLRWGWGWLILLV